MKSYRITYHLGEVYHINIVDAETECDAIIKALSKIPEKSRDLMHGMKAERYFEAWN